jgi:hypothetical protein
VDGERRRHCWITIKEGIGLRWMDVNLRKEKGDEFECG